MMSGIHAGLMVRQTDRQARGMLCSSWQCDEAVRWMAKQRMQLDRRLSAVAQKAGRMARDRERRSLVVLRLPNEKSKTSFFLLCSTCLVERN